MKIENLDIILRTAVTSCEARYFLEYKRGSITKKKYLFATEVLESAQKETQALLSKERAVNAILKGHSDKDKLP